MSKLTERQTFERLVEHVQRECDALLKRVDGELARLLVPGELGEAVRWESERNLLEIQQQLSRAQYSLVHRSDRRYAAAQGLLRDDGASLVHDEVRAA